MSGIQGYWLFLFAGVLLNLAPGQDTMLIIGRSLTGGLRSGVAAACGISVGTICHTLAAALGLSMILATSALAFTIVKLLGAVSTSACDCCSSGRPTIGLRRHTARRRRARERPSCREFSPIY
jgi:hypothetical protein